MQTAQKTITAHIAQYLLKALFRISDFQTQLFYLLEEAAVL
jgi:hypothetical protein